MALIAGYIAGRPQPTELLQERVRTFSILPGESTADYKQTIVGGRFGHVVVKHKLNYPVKPQLVRDVDGNVLVTLGYILSEQSAENLLPAATLSAARSLEQCEGEFVAVLSDSASGAVHVVNDRFSSRPFYVFRRGGATYFSSNLAFLFVIAETVYRPDPIGWLEVSTLGHTLGTRTTAEGIQRLRPATHLTITPDGVTERQYWRLEHRPDEGLDPATHSASVYEAFRVGAERRGRLVGRGVLALSGGLDSRLVAAALPKSLDYSAFTFLDILDQSSTPQTRAAAEVAQALGLRHRIEPLPPPLASPPEVVKLTGGLRPYQHMAVVMAYVQEMQRLNAAFLLGGGPGDVLAGSYIPSSAYLDSTRVAECTADAIRQRFATSRDWHLAFRAEVAEAHRQAVHDSIAESFESVSGPTAAHRVTAWAMVYRQPAFTFSSLLHTHPDVSEAACHLDYRYTDLMLQLPAWWLYERAFYSYMIYAELPLLRHVRYANTGELISGQPPREIPTETLAERLLQRAKGGGRRIAGRLVRSIIPAKGSVPSHFFRNHELLDEVEESLNSIPSLRDLLDVPRCMDLLAKTRADACPSEEVLGTVTSLCVSAATLAPMEIEAEPPSPRRTSAVGAA